MSYELPERPRPSKKKHFIGVIPDTHIGYVVDTPTYSIPSWDIAMQALRHQVKRLTHVVVLGDFGNWESLSHWASLRADQPFVEEDVGLVNLRLDELDALNEERVALGKRPIQFVFIEGNHEAWASQLEAKYPQLRDTVNLRRRLLGGRQHWTWVPENHFWAIGDIHFTHGHIRGNRNPGDLCRSKGVSVIQGHDHALKVGTIRTLHGQLEQWSFGCLASIDPPPPYARGEQPAGWTHGLGWVRVRSNGAFSIDYTRIQDEAWAELPDGTELLVDTRAVRARYGQDQALRDDLRARYSERFYHPGGPVVRTEPHHGKVDRQGRVSPVARTRRARILRTLPDVPRGGSA